MREAVTMGQGTEHQAVSLLQQPAPSSESFEDVYRREALGMVRLAFLMVGSRPQAEEIVQDAFARLRKASQISGKPLKIVAEALIATLEPRSSHR